MPTYADSLFIHFDCKKNDMQDSMLVRMGLTSSACTGSYSGEMALAVVEKTVNDSKRLDETVYFTPVRCHVTRLNQCDRITGNVYFHVPHSRIRNKPSQN